MMQKATRSPPDRCALYPTVTCTRGASYVRLKKAAKLLASVRYAAQYVCRSPAIEIASFLTWVGCSDLNHSASATKGGFQFLDHSVQMSRYLTSL